MGFQEVQGPKKRSGLGTGRAGMAVKEGAGGSWCPIRGCRGVPMHRNGGTGKGAAGTGKGGMRVPGGHCAQERRVPGVHIVKESEGSHSGETWDGGQWGFRGSPVLKKGVLGVGRSRNRDAGTSRVKEKGGGWERQDIWEKGEQDNVL